MPYRKIIGACMAKRLYPTDKQREFVGKIIEGNSLADSYRAAYDAEGMQAQTVRREAHRLTKSHNVAAMLDGARQEEARGIQRSLSLRRRWILERLVGEAEADDSPPAARVRALELLARQAGLFDSAEDRSDARANASEADLAAELEARLGAILHDGSVDVTNEMLGDETPGAKEVGSDDDPLPP